MLTKRYKLELSCIQKEQEIRVIMSSDKINTVRALTRSI